MNLSFKWYVMNCIIGQVTFPVPDKTLASSTKSLGFILWGSWLFLTPFHGNPSSCRDLSTTGGYSPDAVVKKTHILYVLNSPTWCGRWGLTKTCINEWQELWRDMRDNANLHDYTDRWVIYLRLSLTAILNEGHMSGIWSCILQL